MFFLERISIIEKNRLVEDILLIQFKAMAWLEDHDQNAKQIFSIAFFNQNSVKWVVLINYEVDRTEEEELDGYG